MGANLAQTLMTAPLESLAITARAELEPEIAASMFSLIKPGGGGDHFGGVGLGEGGTVYVIIKAHSRNLWRMFFMDEWGLTEPGRWSSEFRVLQISSRVKAIFRETSH